jgi:chromosome segregation ATPase
MSSAPNAPVSGETYQVEAAATPRWIFVVFIILFAALAYSIYDQQATRKSLEADIVRGNQRSEMLKVKLEEADSRLAELKGQLDVTSEKLGLTAEELNRAKTTAQTLKKQQAESDKELEARLGKMQEENAAKLGQVSADVTGAKGDIEATKKDLEATKSELKRTVGDMGVMSGLIARNKEEVEELKRRGERNIFEFDIRKSNAPQRVGPILVRLKKVDTRRLKYTMDVIADDKTVEKKDKTINEPVQFVSRASRAVQEIVVFELSKDRAVGYLSAPK